MNFKQWLNESVTFTIADHNEDKTPKNISDLGFAVKIWLYRNVPDFQKSTNPEGFAPDGLHELFETQGTMNFYPKGIPEDSISKVMSAIKYYLGELGVQFGEFKKDKSNLFRGETVYRISVKMNVGKKDEPQEVNMANQMANTILDMLNIHQGLQGRISVRDLLMKIDNLPDYNIKKHVQEPSVEQEPGHAMLISGGVDETRIKRHLDGLRALAKWAIDHHYDALQWS